MTLVITNLMSPLSSLFCIFKPQITLAEAVVVAQRRAKHHQSSSHQNLTLIWASGACRKLQDSLTELSTVLV